MAVSRRNLDPAIAAELAALDEKLRVMLPPRYEHCYESVSPRSMGSASLQYDAEGRVAWDRIWTSFCDLALAGGPPHRGRLLQPPTTDELNSDPRRLAEVSAELERAIAMTTVLTTVPRAAPGWLGVEFESIEAAAWHQFAVVAENVSARRIDEVLQVPISPKYRAEKEIKNIVVALAKTSHYWDGHLSEKQQGLLDASEWHPASPDESDVAEYQANVASVAESLREAGLSPQVGQYVGWIGVPANSEDAAAWLLRATVVEQVLVRREESVLYLPVGATWSTEQRDYVVDVFLKAWRLLSARG